MAGVQGYIFDLDRTLVDLQSFTDYASALRDVTALVGEQQGEAVPDADWDAPTLSTMAILIALAGDERWERASRAVAAHERAAIPQSVAMTGLESLDDVLAGSPRAVVTLLPEDVYYITGLPTDMQALDVVTTLLIALLMSFLATLYPAWRAARTQPAEALRYE